MNYMKQIRLSANMSRVQDIKQNTQENFQTSKILSHFLLDIYPLCFTEKCSIPHGKKAF